MYLDKNDTHKKSPIQNVWGFFEYGGETQDRTGDTRIFNPLLYLLSYHAEVGVLNNVY